MKAGGRQLPAGARLTSIGKLVDSTANDEGLREWEIAADDDTWWNALYAVRTSYRYGGGNATLGHAPSGLIVIARRAVVDPDGTYPEIRHGNGDGS